MKRRLLTATLLAAAWLGGRVTAGAEDSLATLRPVDHLTGIAAGLTLPVALERGCRAGRCAVGTEILAATTQRVPLNATEYLPRGAEVHGVVTRSEDAGKGSARQAVLALRFDGLRLHEQSLPLRATAVAVASGPRVSDTHAPVNGIADRNIGGEANWTTRQVGGDVVTRAGWLGEVDDTSMRKVGFADFDGVYALSAEAGGTPRASGAFSANAHGLYGFDTAATLRTTPGSLEVQCACELALRTGDNLLLRVE